jgi:sugar phosphate isomerase/epimerase
MGLAATGLATRGLYAQKASVSTSCPFRLAVINDEISPDFDHACDVAANEFGLHWIELRSMWGKTVTSLDAAQIDESKRILAKYNLKVTDIASPLFKSDWPGAPISQHSPSFKKPREVDPHEQDALLLKCIETAKAFGTDRIRCFDFWRLEDPKPYRAAINAKLSEASETCAKHGMILLLENEMACNTGSGEEAVETLAGVPNKNFMLNWDPGNAATFPGNVPYPDAYNKIPKHRIGHCHCKDTVRAADGKASWAPVGGGIIDWTGQFKAFVKDGYHYGVSLETHWHGAATPEESTRISMKGLKETLVKAGITC